MWKINRSDQAALAKSSASEFETEVIAHVRRKLNLAPPVDEAQVSTALSKAYKRARDLLALYDEGGLRHGKGPEASYDTHVRLTLIWVILGEDNMRQTGPSMWLNNDRIGINTRVRLAYAVTASGLKQM